MRPVGDQKASGPKAACKEAPPEAPAGIRVDALQGDRREPSPTCTGRLVRKRATGTDGRLKPSNQTVIGSRVGDETSRQGRGLPLARTRGRNLKLSRCRRPQPGYHR